MPTLTLFHSPYLTQFVDLHVGDRTFRIHEGIIFPYPELMNGCRDDSWDTGTNVLPDACDGLGHALVHYLYTGKYKPQVNDDKVAAFQFTAQLYGIGLKYHMAGLSQMLQTHVYDTAKTLTILDVMGVAQKVCETLSEEDGWLRGILKGKLKAALTIDKHLTTKASFLKFIGTAGIFDRMLMRIVAEIYKEQILEMYHPTPSWSIPSSNDAPEDPQSFEESNLGQDATGEIARLYDEPAPCEEAAVPYDEPEETVTDCDEPAYGEQATDHYDEAASWGEAPGEVPTWDDVVVPCDEANTCCTGYTSWEATNSDDEPYMVETPSESTNGKEGEETPTWDEAVDDSCERPDTFW